MRRTRKLKRILKLILTRTQCERTLMVKITVSMYRSRQALVFELSRVSLRLVSSCIFGDNCFKKLTPKLRNLDALIIYIPRIIEWHAIQYICDSTVIDFIPKYEHHKQTSKRQLNRCCILFSYWNGNDIFTKLSSMATAKAANITVTS